MAKNYASIYASANVAIALEQKFFLKQETTYGELVIPTGADYILPLAGGGAEFTQPRESSPVRSGRHHTSDIKKKKECSWNIPSYFMIDTSLGSPSTSEIDPAMRVLWRNMMGYEDTSSGLKYTPTTPTTSFSIFENGDKWARQIRGAFCESVELAFPGDGEATNTWSGNAKDAIYVGLGKSTANNSGGNTITLVTGDGGQFKTSVGGYVMLIEADGTTRSADTPDGSPRKITNVVGDVVTVDGAALADADGSGLNAPIYLCYYEPETPVAINNPVTGLVGSVQITGIGSICARNMTISLSNSHELENYCYGKDSLGTFGYVAGGRFNAAISLESNMNKSLFAFFQKLQAFEDQVLQLILGDSSGRHLDIDIPKAKFSVPSLTVPESGSIPVTYEAVAYQTTLDAADEISVHFK